ncbi:hypothetical protein GCM10027091_11000 [Streptomyces daliensis]
MSRSQWKWELMLTTRDRENVLFQGVTDAPGNATAESILPGIVADIIRDNPRFQGSNATSFQAHRTN